MSALAFALASAGKDVRRRLRDPLALLLWIGIPLAIGGLISLAMGGGGGSMPKAKVLLVDQDDTFLSGLLSGALGQGGGDVPFELESVELEEGRERIEAGDASALLVLPEGFALALFEEDPITLELITNPAQRILPGLVEEALSMLADLVFYAHRMIGDDLKDFAEGPGEGLTVFPSERIADFSVRVNEKVERLSDWLFPPVLELETTIVDEQGEERGASSPSLGQLFFPGILFMALFFIGQGISDDVWVEKAAGTLRRAVVSPAQTTPFLVGKLLSGAALMGLVGGAALGLGLLVFDLDPATLPLALAWSILFGTGITAVMTLLQTLAGSQRGGSLVTNLLLFPLVMIGGSFFPFEAMPAWMAAVGRRVPNGWALEHLKGILYGTARAGELAAAFGISAAGLALLVWLCALRLRTGFARS